MPDQPGWTGKTSRRRWSGRNYSSAGSPGQIVALFAVSIMAIVALLGMILDGGNIYVQRRTAQNAADAGSLAGTRALMHASPTPDPTLPAGESTISEAICQYVTANAFGTAPKATASFVGVTGNALTAITLPTDPLDPTHTVLKCGGIPVFNSIPPAAAGVSVDATIGPFKTYVAGIVGFGQATTEAKASVQGAAVTAFNANNAPFIICGVNTWVDDGSTKSLLLMSGGTPVIPYQIDPAAVNLTYVIHDSHVDDCGAGSSFKGLGDQAANAGISTLPADLSTLPGTRAGPTRNIVDGVSGCAPGQDDPLNPCVMMVPIATSGSSGTMHCVLWGAFLITQTGANSHSAKLLANYSVGGGPESFTWTWASSTSVSITSMGLSH